MPAEEKRKHQEDPQQPKGSVERTNVTPLPDKDKPDLPDATQNTGPLGKGEIISGSRNPHTDPEDIASKESFPASDPPARY